MTHEKSRGIAFFLSSIPVLGWFGWDKLYIGAYTVFFIQFFATLLLAGCLFSFPMAVFTSIMLVLATFFGAPLGPSFLFPQGIRWRPTTRGDRILILLMIFLYVYIAVMIIIGLVYKEVVMNRSQVVTTTPLKAPPNGPLLP